jgi:hypothetical protein
MVIKKVFCPLSTDLASFSLLPESPGASVQLTQAVSILVPGRSKLLFEPRRDRLLQGKIEGREKLQQNLCMCVTHNITRVCIDTERRLKFGFLR